MDNDELNKSLCEEMFSGEIDVTEKPDGDKSQARKHRDGLHKFNYKDLGILQKAVEALRKMEIFCKTKKNMFLPIRDGIGDAPYELGKLKMCMEDRDTYLDHFEYQVRVRMVLKIKQLRSTKRMS